MSEVPLYRVLLQDRWRLSEDPLYRGTSPTSPVQGYLAHKKTPSPLGPSYYPKHRPTVGSLGDAFSIERESPVKGCCVLDLKSVNT